MSIRHIAIVLASLAAALLVATRASAAECDEEDVTLLWLGDFNRLQVSPASNKWARISATSSEQKGAALNDGSAILDLASGDVWTVKLEPVSEDNVSPPPSPTSCTVTITNHWKKLVPAPMRVLRATVRRDTIVISNAEMRRIFGGGASGVHRLSLGKSGKSCAASGGATWKANAEFRSKAPADTSDMFLNIGSGQTCVAIAMVHLDNRRLEFFLGPRSKNEQTEEATATSYVELTLVENVDSDTPRCEVDFWAEHILDHSSTCSPESWTAPFANDGLPIPKAPAVFRIRFVLVGGMDECPKSPGSEQPVRTIAGQAPEVCEYVHAGESYQYRARYSLADDRSKELGLETALETRMVNTEIALKANVGAILKVDGSPRTTTAKVLKADQRRLLAFPKFDAMPKGGERLYYVAAGSMRLQPSHLCIPTDDPGTGVDDAPGNYMQVSLDSRQELPGIRSWILRNGGDGRRMYCPIFESNAPDIVIDDKEPGGETIRVKQNGRTLRSLQFAPTTAANVTAIKIRRKGKVRTNYETTLQAPLEQVDEICIKVQSASYVESVEVSPSLITAVNPEGLPVGSFESVNGAPVEFLRQTMETAGPPDPKDVLHCAPLTLRKVGPGKIRFRPDDVPPRKIVFEWQGKCKSQEKCAIKPKPTHDLWMLNALRRGSINFGALFAFTDNNSTSYRVTGLLPLADLGAAAYPVVGGSFNAGFSVAFTLPGSTAAQATSDDGTGQPTPAASTVGVGLGPYAMLCVQLMTKAVPGICGGVVAEVGVEGADTSPVGENTSSVDASAYGRVGFMFTAGFQAFGGGSFPSP